MAEASGPVTDRFRRSTRGFTMFSGFKKTIKSLHVPNLEARELAYLDEAGDRIDLECRQREIDRGLFRKRNSFGF